MEHHETDTPPSAPEDQPSPADNLTPLFYSLELATPFLVSSDSLPVDHEELVIDDPGTADGTQEDPALSVDVPGTADGTQEAPALSVDVPGNADGIQESPVLAVDCIGFDDGTPAPPTLSVEVPALVAEIVDMPNTVWYVNEDLAVVENGHGNSNHQLLNLIANSVPDPLASSAESIYFDAEAGEVEPAVFEPGVGQVETNDPVAVLTHADLPADAPASPEHVENPRNREIVPVADLENLPPAIPQVPLALPEEYDDDAPLDFDPLEASPLLESLGFSRVQNAYNRWLQNMSHSISIFQGIFPQACMTTQLLISGFRATVLYYQWPRGNLDRVGRRFVRSLRQTMACYQKVRREPYNDSHWNDLRVIFS